MPTRCEDQREWLLACEFATFYASTVSLLPTHQPSTNKVVNRNRRIGVDIIDFTGWKHEEGLHKVIGYMRQGYDLVRKTNRLFNAEAGVPEAIRVTTVKPGGTVPKIAGRTAGLGHPTFRHTLRRVRVAVESPVVEILRSANVPNHSDVYDPKTLIFEFPIIQGPSRPASEVSLWEQASNLIVMQAEWADNAVSNTLYFKPRWNLKNIVNPFYSSEDASQCDGLTPEDYFALDEMFDDDSKFNSYETHQWKFQKVGDTLKIYEFDPHHEEDQVEFVISASIGKLKSFSLLPHSPKGAYVDIPEEGITEQQYSDLISVINPIDWSQLSGSDGQDEKFCQGASCELNLSN